MSTAPARCRSNSRSCRIFSDRSLSRRWTSDHRDALAAEEEAVAGGAGGDAATSKRLLGFESEIAGAGARGDDQRVAGVFAPVAFHAQRALREVHLVDVVHHDLGVEPLRMLAHALHEAGAGQSVRIPRPVVHLGGGHELAALFHARQQQRLAIGTGCVDGGGVTGGAGTEDDQPGVSGSAHVYFLPLWRVASGVGAAW
jgi:hypothetical protein